MGGNIVDNFVKVGYGKIPQREQLISLYETHTLLEISKIYSTTKIRVSKWFDVLQIEKNVRGGGNNRKFIDSINKEILQNYLNQNLSDKEIIELIGCSRSNLYRLMNKFELKRDYKKTEFQKYERKVRRLTEKTYLKHKDELNPNNYVRGLCGIKNVYQIDHIKSVRECFNLGLSEEWCSSFENLQLISWEENLKRRTIKKNIGEK